MKLNRRAGIILTALAMCYIVAGVYAGTWLSNELTTSWTLSESTSALELYWVPEEPTGPFYKDSWRQVKVGLKNLLGGTHELVTVLFTISVTAEILPTYCVAIEYYVAAGDLYETEGWHDMTDVLTGWDSGTLNGYFGPETGFPVGIGYDEVTMFRIKFDGTAPLTDYDFAAWVEEIESP